jgi:hypothetical protein
MSHARRWTLVAHATSVIVDTCPSHPMLMLSLLGVALAHGLLTESKTFLRLFLTALIPSPRPGVPPVIAHPLYPSYLVELCFEWTHLASKPRAGAFTHRAFVAVTLEVLMEHGPATAWTCKSITRLAQLLRTRDFGCFLSFLRGLIETLTAPPRHMAHMDRDESLALFARLAKWTGVITSDFFPVRDGRDVGEAPPADQFYSIVEILVSAYDAGLHRSTINDRTNSDLRDPQTALVGAAIHCLSAPLFLPTVNVRHQNAILALLRDVPPKSSTFDASLAGRPIAQLRVLAGALRSHKLRALEPAFWRGALEQSLRKGELSGVLKAMHDALTEAVEREREEEDRDAVGNWVNKTSTSRSPPRKRARRKSEVMPSRGSSGRQRWRRVPSPCSSTSISTVSTPFLSSASSSSSSFSARSSLSGSPVPEEVLGEMVGVSEDEGEGEETSCSAYAAPSVKFRSVLADALKTRMDLKAERRRASLRAEFVCGRGHSVSLERGDDSEEDVARALPSEGDVLDMFAYDGHF